MRNVLVVNGLEDEQGRALFVTSALHLCAAHFRHLLIRYVAVRSTPVEIAAQALAFDTGLAVEWSDVHPEVSPDQAFRDALVYAAVAFDDVTGFGFTQAGERGVLGCVAVQFPKAELFPGVWAANLSAAHDPAIFGGLLRSFV